MKLDLLATGPSFCICHFLFFSDGVVTSEEADEVVKKLNKENKKKLKDSTDVEKKSQSDSDSDSSGSESGIYTGEDFQD